MSTHDLVTAVATSFALGGAIAGVAGYFISGFHRTRGARRGKAVELTQSLIGAGQGKKARLTIDETAMALVTFIKAIEIAEDDDVWQRHWWDRRELSSRLANLAELRDEVLRKAKQTETKEGAAEATPVDRPGFHPG
ncbi:MAG: hypothetical protein QNJ16_18530 [Rhodobacter sp.]|nr:hypothetical protein [Rhodobacter sp.]